MDRRAVSIICNLTALTQLTLHGYKRTTQISALQNLKLEELQLEECPGAAQHILSTAAMTTLERLSIWVAREGRPHDVEAFNAALRDTSSPDHTWAEGLHQLGQAVLSLPRLVEVSGYCLLFSCAMAEDLRAWSQWTDNYEGISSCWFCKKLD